MRPNDTPLQGRNDFGRTGYGGPCPPSGTHHYRFTLWALSARLSLSATPSAAEVRTALTIRTLAQTTLTGTYTREG
jgi:Raf kinase inhibitor-like YbhB/YbcL family protein